MLLRHRVYPSNGKAFAKKSATQAKVTDARVTPNTDTPKIGLHATCKVREQVVNLNRILRGHYAYYGVAGNFRSLQQVHRATERYWYKMLCSRSRKGSFRWDMFHRIKTRFPLQRPRLSLPFAKFTSLAVL